MAQSTHPGGAAEKAGIIHESLWGIHCLLEVLTGKAECICIEKPGDDGEEFYLLRSGVKEHWQAKRQVSGQPTWSLTKLRDVLKFFFEKFRQGETCVFASMSDAPELRILIENARAVQAAGEGLDHFKKYFLAKTRKTQFAKLQKLVGARSEEETLAFLCFMRVHHGGEIIIESFIGDVLTAMFQPSWKMTMAALRDLYLRSTHETLTAASIEGHLQDYQINRRHLDTPNAKDHILEQTRTYTEGQKAKLIRGTAIRRAAATEIVTRLKASTTSLDILITAPAGGGKSASLCQVIEGLQEAGMPVLAFRLDRMEPVKTVIQLGEQLGLGESPALVLSEAFPDQPVVLVIDQLDCVSATSGRHPDFFDTVAALRAEVLGLRARRTIHLVMACRRFDFEHDYRLKQLVTEDQPPVEIGSLSPAEVKNVLQQEEGDFSKLTPHQQKMLCLPQNLALYIDAGLAQSENRFTSPTDLCHAYWDAKRKAVGHERPEFDPQWVPALRQLTQRMSERQELSVPAAEMDAFPPNFLERMASEGVLTRDRKRLGFGHETFFDYCFARTQPKDGRDFVASLEGDNQQLFRRAQLRQVLAFLRDSDFSAYLASMTRLLESGLIRPHLKLLAVDLLAAHPQPDDREMELLMPSIEAEMERQKNNQAHQDNSTKLAERIWGCFFSSLTLFLAADRKGLLKKWLLSDDPYLQGLIAIYLARQTEEHAERIAELLEPLIENTEWHKRLSRVMDRGNLDKSRRFFDLCVNLLDKGILDETKDGIPSLGLFWIKLRNLAEKKPEWYAEIAAHWLERQVKRACTAPEEARSLRFYFDDNSGVRDLTASAEKKPQAFLEQVLPAILRASGAFLRNSSVDQLIQDRLWCPPNRDEHGGMLNDFRLACEAAIKKLGEKSPDMLRPFIEQLRAQPLYIANHLLISAYLSAPETFAEESLKLLMAEPARLRSGFQGSSYWHSRQLILECSSRCTSETFQQLEAVLLDFVSSHEQNPEGLPEKGRTAYQFVSVLAIDRMSAAAKSKQTEWREKFKEPDGPPAATWRFYESKPPVEPEVAANMTDEEWLMVVARYHSAESPDDHRHQEGGGALELAEIMPPLVTKQPERFSQLALKFPDGTHPCYFSQVLSGLLTAAIPQENKLAVARRVFNLDDHACFRAALNILGSMTSNELPTDAIQYIQRAASHPDASMEGIGLSAEDEDLIEEIEQVRGLAAETIQKLVSNNPCYLEIFRPTIERLVKDPNVAVRDSVASTLIAVDQHDGQLALRWFVELLNTNDRLPESYYVHYFINQKLREHLDSFVPIIERMLHSSHEESLITGGRFASLARLYNERADFLAEAALSGHEHCRMGACEIAARNLLNAEYRGWCEPTLTRLFTDVSVEVRRAAAYCFWQLWQSPDTPLLSYDALIRTFMSSPAFADDPTYLLYALKETRNPVPETALDVCEAFITRCSEEARDIRTSHAADEYSIGDVVFTTYAQARSPELQKRALSVIDRMGLEGLQSANSHLTEFDR